MARKTKEQVDFELACYERRARGRAAWGLYAAYMGQTNFDNELQRLETDVERGVKGAKKKRAICQRSEKEEQSRFLDRLNQPAPQHRAPVA